MTTPPKNYLLWEGLPFIAAATAQCLCLLSSRYLDSWQYEWFVDPGENFDRVTAILVIAAFLALASLMLHVLRRWWPGADAPDRSFRIAFFSASATFLTFVAAFLINFAPFWIGLDSDGKWQEIQRNST